LEDNIDVDLSNENHPTPNQIAWWEDNTTPFFMHTQIKKIL